MKYDFNKVQDRIGSDSIKWEKQLKFGTRTGLLPFWIADTDFANIARSSRGNEETSGTSGFRLYHYRRENFGNSKRLV